MKPTYDWLEVIVEHEGEEYRVFFENGDVHEVQKNLDKSSECSWEDYEPYDGDLRDEIIDSALIYLRGY